MKNDNKTFKIALLYHVDYLNIVSIANEHNIDIGKRKKTPINNYNTAVSTVSRMFRHVALKYLEKNGILTNVSFRSGSRPRMIFERMGTSGIDYATLYNINYYNRIDGFDLSSDTEISILLDSLRPYIARFTSWSIESGYENFVNSSLRRFVNYSETLNRFIKIIELSRQIIDRAKLMKQKSIAPVIEEKVPKPVEEDKIIQSRKVSSQELFNRAFERWRNTSET